MTPLKNYMQDGACAQARAVLALLQNFTINESWDGNAKRYLADPKVARWENCREQGYVVSLLSGDYRRQMNIAFFEHRNSDSLCAVVWEQKTLNSPTIENANFGDRYKTKWDVSFSAKFGDILSMSTYIKDCLTDFWVKSSLSSVIDN